MLALLLANAGYFAWAQGLLADYGFAPLTQAEPQRLTQQIRPEAMQLLNTAEPPRPEFQPVALNPALNRALTALTPCLLRALTIWSGLSPVVAGNTRFTSALWERPTNSTGCFTPSLGCEIVSGSSAR